MRRRRRFGAFGTIGPARGFTWHEVRCTDGTLPSERVMRKRFRKQARSLNKLRARIRRKARQQYGRGAKVTINVTSWYRSFQYNQKIGGARLSEHVSGRATDITVRIYTRDGHIIRLTPDQIARHALRIPTFRKGGIGIYDDANGNFCHLDHRPNGPARWRNG